MMVAETVEPEKSSSIPGMPVAEVRRHLAAMRRDWYWSLWDRRAELNEAMMARVRGLREALAANA